LKLLLDQNLSHRLVPRLDRLYPGSSHVRLHGLERADDATIWSFAREHGFILVTHDADFYERSQLFGFPPKVIWLRCGNTSTSSIEGILTRAKDSVAAFVEDDAAACLEMR
jgi:predicted nuclease of predicted toxin-antitoxin system